MPFGVSIDIDAVPCVDLGHHWIETFYGRVPSGNLAGMPVRAAHCEACGSNRVDYLTWSGKVTRRDYDVDENYITNARALGEHHERRTNLRTAKNNRLKKQGATGTAPWMKNDADS